MDKWDINLLYYDFKGILVLIIFHPAIDKEPKKDGK